MNKGRTAIALRGGAAVFVLAVGVVSQSLANTPAAGAASAIASETQAPPKDPGGPGGGGGADGALPVVPAHGGCIIGLNCGCIRGITCPGTVQHRRPAPVNDHPHDAPAGPGPGGGG
jgi:hypothetical protein